MVLFLVLIHIILLKVDWTRAIPLTEAGPRIMTRLSSPRKAALRDYRIVRVENVT